jgi:hypothetical protein
MLVISCLMFVLHDLHRGHGLKGVEIWTETDLNKKQCYIQITLLFETYHTLCDSKHGL